MDNILEKVSKMRRQFEFVDYKASVKQIKKLTNQHKKLALQYFNVDFKDYYDCAFNFLDDVPFLTRCNRVVFGAHGPYIEFEMTQVELPLVIPVDQRWRVDPKYNVKYYHYIPIKREEKIYYQIRPVSYADYRINKYYVDLYSTKPQV